MALFGSDPFKAERDNVAQLAAEFESLRADDQERLTRYADYRREMEAAREHDLPARASGELDYGRDTSGADTGVANRHSIPLPFGMALTVKHTYRTSGRMPDANVPRREETPQERYRSDAMERSWWSIVRESGEDTLFSDGGWDGSSLGAACMDVYYHPSKQTPIIRVCDPAGVIVVRGVDNPHDFQRVFRFWEAPLATVRSQYRVEDFDGMGTMTSPVNELQSTHKVGTTPMVMLVDSCDDQREVRFALGGENGSVPLRVRTHGLGFVPKVVIPNIGPYRDVWGWADYEFIRSLVAYIPALLGREADILRMVANGAYIENGTGQDPDPILTILRDGGVLPSKRDGKVEPIKAPEMPSFAATHSDKIMEMFKMLGFAPDASWGGSDTRSGPDRALQLQPLIELTAMKQKNWSRGLSRLAEMSFRMIEQKQLTNKTFRGQRPGLTPKQTRPFSPLTLGPELSPAATNIDGEDVIVPRTPKQLFDGDYQMSFVWQNRIDPDDPAYILGELNKFAQGVQSLRTTLERLGFQAPEDEIKLIEQEANEHPWLREGMIALIKMQIDSSQQGQGGGAPTDPVSQLMGGFSQLVGGGQSSGNDAANALTAATPGATGKLYGA